MRRKRETSSNNGEEEMGLEQENGSVGEPRGQMEVWVNQPDSASGKANDRRSIRGQRSGLLLELQGFGGFLLV